LLIDLESRRIFSTAIVYELIISCTKTRDGAILRIYSIGCGDIAEIVIIIIIIIIDVNVVLSVVENLRCFWSWTKRL